MSKSHNNANKDVQELYYILEQAFPNDTFRVKRTGNNKTSLSVYCNTTSNEDVVNEAFRNGIRLWKVNGFYADDFAVEHILVENKPKSNSELIEKTFESVGTTGEFEIVQVERITIRLVVQYLSTDSFFDAIKDIEKIEGFRGFQKIKWEVGEFPEFIILRDFKNHGKN